MTWRLQSPSAARRPIGRGEAARVDEGSATEGSCGRADMRAAMPKVLAKESGDEVFMPPGGEAEARRFYGQLLGLRETMKPPGEKGVWFQTDAGLFKVLPKEGYRAP